MSFFRQIFRKATKATKTASSSGSDIDRSPPPIHEGPAKEVSIDLWLLAHLNEVRMMADAEAQYWAEAASPVGFVSPVEPIGEVKVLEGRRRRVCMVVEKGWDESW